MFLRVENVLEVWQAGEVDTIPVGTTGRHLGSGRSCRGASRLRRADRKGELLVCRNDLMIELREVCVTLRRGPAGPGVFVLWCSVELVLRDLAAVAAGIGPERSPRPVCEVEKTLQEQLSDLLRSLGEDHNLTTKVGQIEIRNRVLAEIKFAGYQVKDLTFRRVLTGDEYREEKVVWATFQNDLERLLHDEEIWESAERTRLEKAVAALEGERIRALLTEQEKTLEVERRVAKYVQLFPALRAAQPDHQPQLCPHPHCRSDLSISQTFVCGRCQNTLHAFHRSPAKPAWCDECYAVVVRRRKRIAGVVAGLILLMATPGLAWAATWWYAGQLKARAEQRIVARDYAAAFVEYRWLAMRDPDNVENYQRMEKCVRGDENLRRAYLDFCLQQVREHPESAIVHNYLGNAYLMLDPKDREGKAETKYRRALDLAPDLPEPWNNLAILAYSDGDVNRAETLFREYLDRRPGDAEAWTNLGRLYVSKVEKDPGDAGRIEAAKAALRRAIEIEPGLARRYRWAGRLFVAIGRKEDALEAYRLSDRLEPAQPWVRQQIELLEWELQGSPSPTAPKTNDEDELREWATRALQSARGRPEKRSDQNRSREVPGT